MYKLLLFTALGEHTRVVLQRSPRGNRNREDKLCSWLEQQTTLQIQEASAKVFSSSGMIKDQYLAQDFHLNLLCSSMSCTHLQQLEVLLHLLVVQPSCQILAIITWDGILDRLDLLGANAQ